MMCKILFSRWTICLTSQSANFMWMNKIKEATTVSFENFTENPLTWKTLWNTSTNHSKSSQYYSNETLQERVWIFQKFAQTCPAALVISGRKCPGLRCILKWPHSLEVTQWFGHLNHTYRLEPDHGLRLNGSWGTLFLNKKLHPWRQKMSNRAN